MAGVLHAIPQCDAETLPALRCLHCQNASHRRSERENQQNDENVNSLTSPAWLLVPGSGGVTTVAGDGGNLVLGNGHCLRVTSRALGAIHKRSMELTVGSRVYLSYMGWVKP
jgi:hypothetical protein